MFAMEEKDALSTVDVDEDDETSVGAAAPATSSTSLSVCNAPWSSEHMATALAQHFALNAIERAASRAATNKSFWTKHASSN